MSSATGSVDLAKTPGQSTTAVTVDLAEVLDAINRDHSRLGERLMSVPSAPCSFKRLQVRAHYVSFQEHAPMMMEFVQTLATKLVSFCFSNAYLKNAYDEMADFGPEERQEASTTLFMEAVDLFIKAQKSTKRSGEFGEVIAYLLMEWVIGAPQIVAKMGLKTNPEMPVHGSDGIHLKYDAERDRLMVFFGESKCYKQVNRAIKDAVTSVAAALSPDKIKHELMLVRSQFDLSGLPLEARGPILDFLNPMGAHATKRETVAVIFIAFDFASYTTLHKYDLDDVTSIFEADLSKALASQAATLEAELKAAQIDHRAIEAFFLPVPAVADLRSAFHKRIGWKDDAT